MCYSVIGIDWSNSIHLLDDCICAFTSDGQGFGRCCYLGRYLAGVSGAFVRIDLCWYSGESSVDSVLCVDGDVVDIDGGDGGESERLSAAVGQASSYVGLFPGGKIQDSR
jgi:hypothetical protein